MKFEVVRYECFAVEGGGEAMVVTLDKTPDYQQSSLVGVKSDTKVKGIGGSMTLTLYEKHDQDQFKRLLGKQIEVGLKL